MDSNDATIQTLRAQERALGERIAELEEAMLASSTPGIREFRRTRLLQLEGNRVELSDRLRRLETGVGAAIEVPSLTAALRGATQSVQGTFGC